MPNQMKIMIGSAVKALLLVTYFLVLCPNLSLAHDPAQIPDLVETLLPTVVGVTASQPASVKDEKSKSKPRAAVPNLPKDSPFREFFEDYFEKQPGDNHGKKSAKNNKSDKKGAGFVIDSSGFIVTTDHTVAQAAKITVTLHDGTKLLATLAGRDPKTDLALLKVHPKSTLKAGRFGDSDALRVGEQVIIIGNPFGLIGSVSSGIVSAKNRNISAGPYDAFIQTDAAINKGNTGGPMFNLKGEVVGINTLIVSPSGGSIGVGFAVPSSIVKDVIHQLRTYGRMRRGKLGVKIQTVTDKIARALGLEKPAGALVAGVSPGSSAAVAGIKIGDVLLKFNDRKILQMRQLPRFVAQTAPGTPVDVELLRNGERLVKTITIGRLEDASAPSISGSGETAPAPIQKLVRLGFAGMTVEPMTSQVRAKYKILPSIAAGVVVTSAKSTSPAASNGIKPGTVILEVGQRKVLDLNDLVEIVEGLKTEGRKTLLLLISDAQGDLRYFALPLGDGVIAKTMFSPKDRGQLLTIRQVQQALADLGMDPGPVDGKLGGKTEQAIRKFKAAHGLAKNNGISGELGLALQRALAARKAPAVSGDKKPSDLGLDDLEGLGKLE